jgi:rhodanese-related sulfurtransferase
MGRNILLILVLFLLLSSGCMSQEPPMEEAIDLGPPPSPPITTDAPSGPSPTGTTPPETPVDKWSATAPVTSTSGIFTVSPSEAYEVLQDSYGGPSFIVVDLRTPQEHSEVRLVYASMNIDHDAPDFNERIGELDRGNTYFVYCKADSRTPGALDTMADMGFTTVYGLEGGIVAWEDAGFEVER